MAEAIDPNFDECSNVLSNMDKCVEVLSQTNIFKLFQLDTLRDFAGSMMPIHFEKGEYIIRAGEKLHNVYIIINGTAIVTGRNRDGSMTHHGILQRFDHFGIKTMFLGPNATVSVQANEIMSCYKLSSDRLMALLLTKLSNFKNIREEYRKFEEYYV